jgi:hypothetical protein
MVNHKKYEGLNIEPPRPQERQGREKEEKFID